MEAVDAIIEHLKRMSKQVTTPEEIAQVDCNFFTVQLSCSAWWDVNLPLPFLTDFLAVLHRLIEVGV